MGTSGGEGGRGRGGRGGRGRGRGALHPADAFSLKDEERLQKFLSHAGIDSRRQCEQMILDGRVRVNGKMVKGLGTKVRSKDGYNGRYAGLYRRDGITQAASSFRRSLRDSSSAGEGRELLHDASVLCKGLLIH